MTTAVTRPPKRVMPRVSLTQLADYWRENHRDVFPNLPATARGWDEPFCFRCGWLAPMPDGPSRKWSRATGWLERAHLRDHLTSDDNNMSNMVPLCTICHRGMPDFPDSRDEAIDWMKAQGHTSCPNWWQSATDSRWGGDRYASFPGRVVFVNAFIDLACRLESARAAAGKAEVGVRA